jgi:glycosyltransferase involved in cell wall biosynthesis
MCAHNAPLFSVIIPTYGRGSLLNNAVESVIAQSVTDLECIVVDDHGPEAVNGFDDPRVRVKRRGENGGPARARNTGLRLARGKFVAFLDDDDEFTPDRLEIAMQGLSRAPVAVCWTRFIGANDGRGRVLEGDVRNSILDGLTPNLGATVARRDRAAFFDERFDAVQDVEWWLRLAQANKITTDQRVGYLVRRHNGRRHRNGLELRVRYNQLLLNVHSDYFKSHPHAAAFRWKRMGLISLRCGDSRTAREAFVMALRLHPQAVDLWHWMRTFRPR